MQFQTIGPRLEGDKVFVTVVNAEAAVLTPGQCTVWALGTNATQPAGVAAILPANVVNLTTGLVTKVAGVVPVGGTISTGAIGLLQVYGYHGAVRSSASHASGRMVVTSSINATNIGSVDLASQSTLTGPEYVGAIVGWTVENSANATQDKVFLTVI